MKKYEMDSFAKARQGRIVKGDYVCTFYGEYGIVETHPVVGQDNGLWVDVKGIGTCSTEALHRVPEGEYIIATEVMDL